MSIVKGSLSISGLVCILAVQACFASESEIGELLVACTGCHGEQGVSVNPMVPTLAGQPFTLIEDNLLAFRSGKRACKPGQFDDAVRTGLVRTMCGLVADLDDDEIERLASYFEGQVFIPARQSFDPGAVSTGADLHVERGCEHCHSDGGKKTNAMAPVLAGQWTPYLRQTMKCLQSGARNGPKMMNDSLQTLTESEVESLLNYYASQQGE